MARDYAASTLDMDRLQALAHRVAGTLLGAAVGFSGYSDEPTLTMDEAKNHGFTWFGEFERRGDLATRHLGYWTLETETRAYISNRRATPTESTSVRTSTRWVLLETGDLATVHFAEFNLREHWVETTLLSEQRILLLDHRTRRSDRTHSSRGDFTWDYSIALSEDNYLITGRKGGGASKRLTELLNAHDLGNAQPGGGRSSRPAPRERLPIAQTYAVSPAALADGCQIEHTFANGTRTVVTVRPGTRPGKVIVVRTARSDGPEAIRVTVKA